MPEPGDIISQAQVKKIDTDGTCWIKGSGVEGCILFRHLPTDSDPKPGQTVRNLVCLSEKSFALSHYEADLIRYFYSEGGEEARKPDVWIPRWKEGGYDPAKVNCKKPADASLLPKPAKYREWRFARMQNWMMPVSLSAYVDFIEKNGGFCPSALAYTKSSPYIILPSLYRKKLFGENVLPPLCYEAELTYPKSAPRRIRVYLHGHLEPRKWHYSIWKHLLSGPPSADRNEKKLWEKWLGHPLPGNSEVANIFKNCYENKNKKNCRWCGVSQFQKVHEAMIESLSPLYWNRLVTFFESDATKKVFVSPKVFVSQEVSAQQTDHDFYEIKLWSTPDKPVKLNKRKVFPYLNIEGWCYNFDDSEKDVVFHLSTLTFYLENRNRLKYNPISRSMGDLKNVKRL